MNPSFPGKKIFRFIEVVTPSRFVYMYIYSFACASFAYVCMYVCTLCKSPKNTT
jgi:hypothetical protein